MKRVLFNLLISGFLFALFAATALAQTKGCAVKINVAQNDGATSVRGAGATATNKATKRIYRSVLKAGMPFFAKLPDGNYRVRVSKIGFKTSIDDFRLDCSEAADEPWSINLFKGRSRQIVNLNDRRVLKSSPLKRDTADQYTEGNINVAPTVNENRYRTSSETNTPRTVSGGVVNGKAANLVKPPYPAAARAVRASGAVNVLVTISESGDVISASAVSGHPLLRAAAVQAARASTFTPTLLEGQPVKVTGVIVYNFVP
jgi:TonB family protein